MYKVEGFEFATEEQAQQARKEAEGIKYIKNQTNMKDAVTVLKLHNRLLQKEVFTTLVGYTFLGELRAYLNTIPYIDSEDIEPMPYEMEQALLQLRQEKERQTAERANRRTRGKKAAESATRREFNYRTGFFVSTGLAAMLALALIGMFVITALSGNNVNIINYENALIDKYEYWEQDLLEREEALREAQTGAEDNSDEVSE